MSRALWREYTEKLCPYKYLQGEARRRQRYSPLRLVYVVRGIQGNANRWTEEMGGGSDISSRSSAGAFPASATAVYSASLPASTEINASYPSADAESLLSIDTPYTYKKVALNIS